MSKNLIALQNRFLGNEKTAYGLLSARRRQRGKISTEDIDQLAADHHLPAQLLRSTAEFYDELKPQAASAATHHLQVCNGEACRAAGSDDVKQQLVSHFADRLAGKLEIGDVTCLGYCSSGPNLWLDQQPLSVASRDIKKTIDHYLATAANNFEPPQNNCYLPADDAPAVLMPYLQRGDQVTAGLYQQLKTALVDHSPEQLLAQIRISELRGRGGAGFPLATKLQTVRNSGNGVENESQKKYLVVNFDEGDAGAYIDKELVERCPALLLCGALLAAHACGASSIYIYARLEYPEARRRLADAVQQLSSKQMIGDRIAGSEFSCNITIIEGQGAYICGEETSLLRSIEGLPATVSIRPPFPAEQGLWGRPTAVCNVETLCNLPWIVEHGGKRYAKFGHEKSRGTKLVSLNTRVKRPGLYEVELGTTLRQIIFDLAGGMADGEIFKAVQIGGPLGGILPASALDTPLAFESLQQVGGILGHGGMVIYSENDDLAKIARGVMAFCGRESCGKCFPCRIGSVRATELLDQISESGATPERLELLTDICDTMKAGSLCAMGSMTPAAVESVLTHFPTELGQGER